MSLNWFTNLISIFLSFSFQIFVFFVKKKTTKRNFTKRQFNQIVIQTILFTRIWWIFFRSITTTLVIWFVDCATKINNRIWKFSSINKKLKFSIFSKFFSIKSNTSTINTHEYEWTTTRNISMKILKRIVWNETFVASLLSSKILK